MARELSLLDRIATLRDSRRRDVDEDLDALLGSIRQNLERLLNSRQSMCETVPDYGLPEFGEVAAGTVAQMGEAIQKAVERFERRLKRPQARAFDPGDGRRIVYRVEGVVATRAGEQRVWYEATLRPGGRIELSG